MKKKIVALFSALLMTTVFTQGLATPAHAGIHNNVRHAPDDSGYNDPIKVMCLDATNRWLGLGQYSSDSGKCPSAGYVEYILPKAGTKVRCVSQFGNWYEFNYNGGSGGYVPSELFFTCYNQLV